MYVEFKANTFFNLVCLGWIFCNISVPTHLLITLHLTSYFLLVNCGLQAAESLESTAAVTQAHYYILVLVKRYVGACVLASILLVLHNDVVS